MKLLLGLPALLLAGCGAATIGGTEVPADLHCEEDEVIGFLPIGEAPYDLVCYHWEGGTATHNGVEVTFE